MNNISILMKGISSVANVQFILSCDGRRLYASEGISKEDFESLISKRFSARAEEYTISVTKENERVLPLLIHFVKNTLIEADYKKDKIIIDLLKGNKVSKDEISSQYPFLLKKCSIIVIFAEDNIEEVLKLVEEAYRDIKTVKVLFNDKIIILGELNDAKEHAFSLRDTLAYDFCGKCVICYYNVNKYSDLKDTFDICTRKIDIALKLDLDKNVIGEKDLLFEEAIEGISIDTRKRLVRDFSKGFEKIDPEMFRTVDIFFKCGLNLSEASKNLYIHRNTLIYRLDKIFKETGFDLRDFSDAVVFKIILLIWKQFKN